MVHLSIDTAIAMSPQLVDIVRTTNTLSPAERLFLAKTLLDSLVADETQTTVEPPSDKEAPMLAQVVAQIKATPPNPRQIQRATKTVDEVLGIGEESPTEEPLTLEEWEQNWWSIRQEMRQRDQQPDPFTDQNAGDHE